VPGGDRDGQHGPGARDRFGPPGGRSVPARPAADRVVREAGAVTERMKEDRSIMHSSCPSRPGRRFGAWGSKTAWAFGLLVALAGRLGAAAPRDELLRFVPADVGFCLVLQDLRGPAADLLASPFVRQLRQS